VPAPLGPVHGGTGLAKIVFLFMFSEAYQSDSATVFLIRATAWDIPSKAALSSSYAIAMPTFSCMGILNAINGVRFNLP
jgi:hypothetical protein